MKKVDIMETIRNYATVRNFFDLSIGLGGAYLSISLFLKISIISESIVGLIL